MSCCEVSGTRSERIPGTGCCGSKCSGGKTGCSGSEPRIRQCSCQANVGCLDRADCGGFRPSGTAATGACPGPCQCAEEEAWNSIIPPKPNCEWLSNFCELRQQWSDHSRMQICECCNSRPCRKAALCQSCPPSTFCEECGKDRLSGGGTATKSSNTPSYGCSPPNYNSQSNYCQNKHSEPYPSFHQCPQPTSKKFKPPSSCKPCSPSPRPILKKRSCCQSSAGYCMCQPMPKDCGCPPVHIDARANRECTCECPSSPECACPPSERRFPRSRVKCENSKMCPPQPRLSPGPKCLCSECQPCLPPPCDPCTSRKCKTIQPRNSPCRLGSPTKSEPCRSEAHRSLQTCSSCRKISRSYHDNFYDEHQPSEVRIHSSGQYLGLPDARDADEDGVVQSGNTRCLKR